MRDFLGVQWLGLCASIAGGMGPIPGWRTRILSAAHGLRPYSQPIKKIELHHGRGR